MLASYTVCPETSILNFITHEESDFIQEIDWRANENNIRVTPANVETFPFIDTTGYSAKMQFIAKGDPTETVLLTLDSSDQIIFNGTLSPNVVIKITRAQVEALGVGTFTYDLIITMPDGYRFTWLIGDFVIKNNITSFA